MLVVSRKPGQSIVVGNDITVVITGVRNGKVYVGIDAPKSVPIFRQEVLESVRVSPGMSRHGAVS